MSKKPKAASRGRGRPQKPEGATISASVNVPPAMLAEIDELAKTDERSRSHQMLILLREALQARRGK